MPIDPNIVQCISALEVVCVDREATIYKRLLALESICINHIVDECDVCVTALEMNVADVNIWRTKLGGLIDDLRLKVQKVSMHYDRAVFDTSSHQPGHMALPTVAAQSSIETTANEPNGHHVV